MNAIWWRYFFIEIIRVPYLIEYFNPKMVWVYNLILAAQVVIKGGLGAINH